MNKIILAAVALLIIAVAIMMLPVPVTQETGPADEVTQPTVETEQIGEDYLLENFYIELLQEQMDQLNIEQTDFNNQVEDDMASDMSQFYY